MDYSTDGKIIMPEYGRNVQRMVEYALTIEDKEERTLCVQSIMRTMSNLFPYLRNEESKHKMYDHLAIMSNYQLDVDSPFNTPTASDLKYKPQQLPYNTESKVKYRHYGKLIEAMIEEAIQETNTEKQEAMINVIANRMKQNALMWNSDNVEDTTIKADIEHLSKGKLNCNYEGFRLSSSKALHPQQNSSGKSNTRHRKKKK